MTLYVGTISTSTLPSGSEGDYVLISDTNVLNKFSNGEWSVVTTSNKNESIGKDGDKFYATGSGKYYEKVSGVFVEIIPTILDRSASITNKIRKEIQSLSPDSIIELFVLDTHPQGGTEYLRFHAGTNGLRQSVYFNAIEYKHLPIEAEGFAAGSSNGAAPRPVIRLANLDGAFSALVAQYDDLVGCKITRRRTLLKYIDAVNFPNSTNPTADPRQQYPDDVWYINQKTTEDRSLIEWELASPSDLSMAKLPARQIIKDSCSWKYKTGVECGYNPDDAELAPGVPNPNYGLWYNFMDELTSQGNDKCGKRLSSCAKRFGKADSLPFGGFPGANRYV